MIKKRKWWIAGLFSLLLPGLGQIYNGQAKKGILFIILPLIFYPLWLYSILTLSIIKILLITFLVLVIFYYFFVLYDAIVHARKSDDYVLKKYNSPLVYLGIYFIPFFIGAFYPVDFLKNNFMQAFKLGGASMEPALLLGDHILADRRVSARKPVRGDLVVFEFPEDTTKDYIKRVVAVG